MSELSKKLQRYREERDYYRDKYMKGRERIEQLEAELHDSEGAYKWLKSELRTNAKIIGEQRDTIEQLEADLKTSHEAVAEYIDDIERLEAAVLDFFIHEKRETRAALRDLVGGVAAINDHKKSEK